MNEKRPKINVEMNFLDYYPYIREDLKKELEAQFPNDPEVVTQNLNYVDELYTIEKEMAQIMASFDQKLMKAENNALTFLEATPKHIPFYIKRLADYYEQWKKENT